MLRDLRHPEKARQGFTLVEVAIGMAIFSIVAMAVLAASMRAYKDAEDTNRYLAAHALAISVLQQLASMPKTQHSDAVLMPTSQTYTVYDSSGQVINLMIDPPAPITTHLFSTLAQGERHATAQFEVTIDLDVAKVTDYDCYQINVACSYVSPSTHQTKTVEVSTLTPSVVEDN
ncbi:MAG: hypothetical protein E1N59_377 [Puniceicoccaceae bacterium 5H]|nr:MAG: hypothetical protein E1N59_377 [Puniceicoccaceae bacterium 5H]